MKLQIGKTASDIIVAVYLGATLLIRLFLEPQLKDHLIVSLLLGIFGLFFLWALINSKILNPNYFGLLESKSPRRKRK